MKLIENLSESGKKLALFAASVSVSLVLAEFILRLFVVQETKRLAIYDSELGWRGKPNGSEIYIRSVDGIRVPFHYNELGYRDDPIQPRSAVAKRILLLGDSFVENLEEPFEQTYVALTRSRLRETLGTSVDVVAIGSQGYSTAQEILAFRKFYQELRPDYVVLFFFTGNDFEDNARREFARLDSAGRLVFLPNRDSWARRQYLSFKRWLYEHSHVVFFLKNFLETRAAMNLHDPSKEVAAESEQYKFEITRQLILAADTLARERGSEFAVAVFSNKYEIEEGRWEKTEFIENICRSGNIPCLTFKDLKPAEHFFPVDIHFNKQGHRVVAERLFAFLLSTFNLPSVALQ